MMHCTTPATAATETCAGTGPTCGDPPSGPLSSLERLPVTYPRAFADALGYAGDRRFVGFCLRGLRRHLVMYDGSVLSVGEFDPHTFASVVAPTAERQGANVGAGPGGVSHLFIWDRRSDAGYVAPVSEAWDLLERQEVV